MMKMKTKTREKREDDEDEGKMMKMIYLVGKNTLIIKIFRETLYNIQLFIGGQAGDGGLNDGTD